MSGFDVTALLGASAADVVPGLVDLSVRMTVATVLGAALSFRLWRWLMPWVKAPSLHSAQSQTLIAAAGAVMVVVIGDHPARAFGLVGLGSFIRFRSGIADPRDAAAMFVMIGIGMACGLGLLVMAVAATLFIGVLLALFDMGARRVEKAVRVVILADDAPSVERRLCVLFPGARILESSANAPELGKDSGRLRVELPLGRDVDAHALRARLEREQVRGIRRVALELDD